MIAACYRRSGNYQQALSCYKMIHRKFPDNIECVKFLVRICQDLALPEYNDFYDKLKKLEKARESRERKSQSGRSAHRSGSRASSTNRTSAESSRGDSASSNSSGYVTSVSINSKNGNKKKSIFDLIENKPADDENIPLDDETLTGPSQRPTTSWRKRNEDEYFISNDEIIDILPE